jgi:hypothetical protein
MKRVGAVIFLAVFATSCQCESGRMRRKAASFFKSPDAPTVEKLVRADVKKSKSIASRLCGLEADGFEPEEIKISSGTLPGMGYATVSGKPIGVHPRDGGLTPALICSGVLLYSAQAATDADGNVQNWKLASLEATEVTTPGHEWKEPSGGHHHH